jgi:hypothetical protein
MNGHDDYAPRMKLRHWDMAAFRKYGVRAGFQERPSRGVYENFAIEYTFPKAVSGDPEPGGNESQRPIRNCRFFWSE